MAPLMSKSYPLHTREGLFECHVILTSLNWERLAMFLKQPLLASHMSEVLSIGVS